MYGRQLQTNAATAAGVSASLKIDNILEFIWAESFDCSCVFWILNQISIICIHTLECTVNTVTVFAYSIVIAGVLLNERQKNKGRCYSEMSKRRDDKRIDRQKWPKIKRQLKSCCASVHNQLCLEAGFGSASLVFSFYSFPKLITK